MPDTAPLISTEVVGSCPVCSGSERARIAAGQDYEYESCRNEWTMWQCRRCSHAWLDPRPADRELGVIYPRHYYSYDFEKKINPIAVKGKAWLDRRKLAGLAAQLRHPPQGYLDVGCGTGRFLRMAEKFDLPRSRIAGIELSEPAIAALRADGFSAECATVEASQLVRTGRFDLITMFHVIEHVADPREVVARLAQALEEGGILAIETPNLESLDARLFRARWWGGYHFPRHWHIFTLASLTQLLRQAGLEVETVRYQPGHSFWLFSLHHALKYGRCRNRRAAGLVHPLRSLPALILATGFDILRSWLGFHTSAMMVVARRRPAQPG
ncbi:class I SAM-dependent methyltransferase [Solimonas sp. K1W22B-7]|uniref:class I SAM-dependent methyltransferase n=1 Tax=Solimonas sp. K1W22B-7 TaxID=2303331 RepID=UPI0013C40250|nr:class I SAM-dependent methyltransferase [Solimonas sp. K1W22B-7]